jgi:fatty-acyl-CoA synthase
MRDADKQHDTRDRVLSWLDRVRPEYGLHFAQDPTGWRFVPYDELAAFTVSTAASLAEHGVLTGDVVSIVAPTSMEFVAAFYGAILAGGTASPLVPPGYLQGDYVAHIAAAMKTARPRAVVASVECQDLVRQALQQASLGASIPVIAPAQPTAMGRFQVTPAAVSLLQFTSGSSGRPRGVRVARRNLSGQIAMLEDWMHILDTDALAAWLPLYHDMGLIGLLTAVDAQGDAYLLRPEQFILAPERWLEAMSHGQATITATPNFGFSFVQKRLAGADLSHLDFERWKTVIVGAERLDPAVFAGFADMFADRGFSPTTFAPAYGLAEATLAVTGLALDQTVQVTQIDWSELTFGSTIKVEDQGELSTELLGDGRGWIMGCGRPLRDTSVWVVDDSGAELPEGHFGQIHVRGPAVALGYLSETAGVSDFNDGVLATGDAGFLLDGQLYVVGRIGEALKVRGRNVYAEDLEGKISTLPGVPRGRCVALASPDEGRDTVTILMEAEAGPWIEQAKQLLRHELGPEVQVRLLQVPRLSIERTSSGKPRRRATWQRLREGNLDFDTLAEWGGPEVVEPVS